MMRSYVLFALFALILLAGCVVPVAPGNATNNTLPLMSPANQSNITIQNQTNASTTPSQNITKTSADLGDTVWVDYTLRVDGKVYDTNNATLANESGIFNPRRKYEPFTFMVEFNKGVIDGFVINVIAMRINETVTFSVDPARGYGLYDESKILSLPRYYNKSLYETIPRSYFEEQGITNISKGMGFDTSFGTVFIDSLNDSDVTLFYMLKPGQKFSVSGIPQQVINTSNMTATIEFALQENESYVLPHPQTGAATMFKVLNKTDQDISVDSNHPLAGKTLYFTVTLLRIE